MTEVHIKRIYDEPKPEDGFRILVDRLWPRGVSKEKALLDEWAKDIAPSAELRMWFKHDSGKFAEFSHRYRKELETNPALAAMLKVINEHKTVTLLYAARDSKINHAAVLQDYLHSK